MPYDNCKELAADLRLENEELRSRLKESTRRALELDRERVDLKMQLKFARDKLRDSGNSAAVERQEDAPRCARCCTDLEYEWTFCPQCGSWLDWLAPPDEAEDDGAYDRWRDEQLEREIERGDAA